MTSAIGGRTGPHTLPTPRRAPLPGEIGHIGTCPLCSQGKGTPPCLACREELRARVLEMQSVAFIDARALN